jgi:hypothetical protein
MRRLTRAATAWIWADTAVKVAGLVAVVGIAAFCVVAIWAYARILGL